MAQKSLLMMRSCKTVQRSSEAQLQTMRSCISLDRDRSSTADHWILRSDMGVGKDGETN